MPIENKSNVHETRGIESEIIPDSEMPVDPIGKDIEIVPTPSMLAKRGLSKQQTADKPFKTIEHVLEYCRVTCFVLTKHVQSMKIPYIPKTTMSCEIIHFDPGKTATIGVRYIVIPKEPIDLQSNTITLCVVPRDTTDRTVDSQYEMVCRFANANLFMVSVANALTELLEAHGFWLR